MRFASWLGLSFCATLSFSCPAAPAAGNPIRIGMVAELTGANRDSGAESVMGANIAVDQINRAGGVLGRPLQLVAEDNQSTNPGSAAAIAKVLGEDDVKALIMPPRSTEIATMMPAIAKAGIPTFATGTLYALTHAGNPWMFRVPAHYGYTAKALADFGVRTLKKRKWAVMYSEESFGIDARDRFLAELRTLGVERVLVQGITYSAQSYSPAVAAIKEAGSEIVVFAMARTGATAELAKELRRAGVDSVFMGGPGIYAKSSLSIGGAALHGSYAAIPEAMETTSRFRALAAEYASRSGNQEIRTGAWVYDAVQLLALAIGRAGTTEPDAIRRSLLSIRGYQGASGTFTFDRNGDGLHEVKIVRNDDGKFTFVRYMSFPPD